MMDASEFLDLGTVTIVRGNRSSSLTIRGKNHGVASGEIILFGMGEGTSLQRSLALARELRDRLEEIIDAGVPMFESLAKEQVAK